MDSMWTESRRYSKDNFRVRGRICLYARLSFSIITLSVPAYLHAQAYSMTEAVEYHDDLGKWVLGQQKKITVNGIVSSETTYSGSASPETIKSFGKLQQTITYYANGAVATVRDGNNNVTTFSNWKRGVPQNVQYADGTTKAAVVDDAGAISSVTDENGYVTSYGYDVMGRLSSISYPTGDSVAWATTTVEFRPLTASEWRPPGVEAGQWRQYTSAGNYQKVVYFDSLWRPVLSHEYDAANTTGTLRSISTSYDNRGRVTFQSYPSSDLIPGSTGTWAFHDALGRVVEIRQDSEQGQLITKTEYLSGLQTRVTNPRGYKTLTGYMVYDQPSYDWPVTVNRADGTSDNASTDIVRDVFGKPTAVRRRNSDGSVGAWRYYVYDGYQQLCKAIEPEIGSTVMDHDAAGNLAWTAAGHALPDTNNCNKSEGYGWGRRVDRTYDARNRLSTLSFPDGRGSQSWAYTPDGQPSQITTYNDPNNGAGVVNTYNYNKRRLLTAEYSGQTGWYTWGVGYGYTANGQLASQSYPTGLTVTYSPNALGQPTAVSSTDGWTYASGVSYYPNGSIKQFTYGNGIVHTMTQNVRQLPARSTDAGVVDYENSFDANGNAAAILDRVRGDHYSRWMTYDGLDRLSSVGSCSFGGDCWHRFTYDALDNLKSWKLAGVKDYADYVYDASNRLVNIKNSANATVVGLGYDVQGNLANKNGQTYSFDFGNRLRDTPGKEWYRYDGHGRRVLNWRATEPGVLSIYSQAGQLLYDENYRAAGRKATEYIYLAGSLINTRARNIDTNAWTVSFQHTDALGSPVAVTNTAGAVIDRTDYEPYGSAINKPSYDGIGFTGHVQDGATGLTYMQQRYYDPTIGRFLSNDPVAAYSDPIGQFNRYKYAGNNPFKFIDPDGRYDCQNLKGTACDEKEKTRMEGYVTALRAAQQDMQPGAAADRLGRILDKIGTLNDNNGVTLKFASLEKGTLGERQGSVLRIDERQITNSAKLALKRNPGWSAADMRKAVAGGVIGHEGSHFYDTTEVGKGSWYPWTLSDRRIAEIKAYGVDSAVDNVLGINSSLNSPGMSIAERSKAIQEAAQGSIDTACKNGGQSCH